MLVQICLDLFQHLPPAEVVSRFWFCWRRTCLLWVLGTEGDEHPWIRDCWQCSGLSCGWDSFFPASGYRSGQGAFSLGASMFIIAVEKLAVILSLKVICPSSLASLKTFPLSFVFCSFVTNQVWISTHFFLLGLWCAPYLGAHLFSSVLEMSYDFDSDLAFSPFFMTWPETSARVHVRTSPAALPVHPLPSPVLALCPPGIYSSGKPHHILTNSPQLRPAWMGNAFVEFLSSMF